MHSICFIIHTDSSSLMLFITLNTPLILCNSDQNAFQLFLFTLY